MKTVNLFFVFLSFLILSSCGEGQKTNENINGENDTVFVETVNREVTATNVEETVVVKEDPNPNNGIGDLRLK